MIQLLCIAGLDPSGGAGILADARVAQLCGVRCCGVVTAQTVQDSRGVRSVHPGSPEVIQDQLAALLSDTEVAAVKIGMLGTEAIARAVSDALDLTSAPVVLDPVGAPTSGSVALYQGSLALCAQILSRHLRVITPNIQEAEALGSRSIQSVSEQQEAARQLADAFECGVVITGGHLDIRGEVIIDAVSDGGRSWSLEAERVDTPGPVHGTGCAFSTALACGLGLDRDLEAAVGAAGAFVRARLTDPVRTGRGNGSVT